MIKEFEFYHGAALTAIIHYYKYKPLSIRLYPSASNASYVLNDVIGLYIKHSSKRLSPWRFVFQRSHQEEILRMKEELKQVFVLLVCEDDGIVTLNFTELKILIGKRHEQTEWISAARTPNTEYTIKGSEGGELNYKIGKNDFPKKLFGRSKSKR